MTDTWETLFGDDFGSGLAFGWQTVWNTTAVTKPGGPGQCAKVDPTHGVAWLQSPDLTFSFPVRLRFDFYIPQTTISNYLSLVPDGVTLTTDQQYMLPHISTFIGGLYGLIDFANFSTSSGFGFHDQPPVSYTGNSSGNTVWTNSTAAYQTYPPPQSGGVVVNGDMPADAWHEMVIECDDGQTVIWTLNGTRIYEWHMPFFLSNSGWFSFGDASIPDNNYPGPSFGYSGYAPHATDFSIYIDHVAFQHLVPALVPSPGLGGVHAYVATVTHRE